MTDSTRPPAVRTADRLAAPQDLQGTRLDERREQGVDRAHGHRRLEREAADPARAGIAAAVAAQQAEIRVVVANVLAEAVVARGPAKALDQVVLIEGGDALRGELAPEPVGLLDEADASGCAAPPRAPRRRPPSLRRRRRSRTRSPARSPTPARARPQPPDLRRKGRDDVDDLAEGALRHAQNGASACQRVNAGISPRLSAARASYHMSAHAAGSRSTCSGWARLRATKLGKCGRPVGCPAGW